MNEVLVHETRCLSGSGKNILVATSMIYPRRSAESNTDRKIRSVACLLRNSMCCIGIPSASGDSLASGIFAMSNLPTLDFASWIVFMINVRSKMTVLARKKQDVKWNRKLLCFRTFTDWPPDGGLRLPEHIIFNN